MNTITQQGIYDLLGWTLIHFLWQGLLVGVLVWAVSQVTARRKSTFRYLLFCCGLVLLALCPIITLTWSITTLPIAATTAATEPQSVFTDFASTVSSGTILHSFNSEASQNEIGESDINASPEHRNLAGSFGNQQWIDTVRKWSPWLIRFWAIGVCALSLRMMICWRKTQRIKALGVQLDSASLQDTLDQLCCRLGIRQAVQLRRTDDVDTPAVVGWMRPVILLPASAVTGLAPDQMYAVLAHELAHIRRHDYLINLFQSVFEILLFYHPIVWWMSSEVRKERENCCDDLALSVCSSRRGYIEALLELESHRHDATLAMAANGGSLLQRVSRMLGKSQYRWRGTNWLGGFISLLVAGFVLCCLLPEQKTPAQVLVESNEEVDESADSESKIDFTMRVVDLEGEPIANAKIYLSASQDDPPMSNKFDIATNSEGFVTQEIREGTTRVRAWCRAEGFAPLFANWEPEYFSNGKQLPKQFIYRMVPAESIGGRIVDSEGEPIQGAKVQVTYRGGGMPPPGDRQRYNTWLAYGDAAVVTDEEGHWVLENIPPGDDVEVSLMINHPDYASDEQSGELQKQQSIRMKELADLSAKIVMKKGARIFGKITQADSKQPVTDAVVVWGDNPYLQRGSQETRVNKKGEYQFPTMKATKKRVTVLAPGFQPESRVVEVRADMGATDFQLKPGKKLQIQFSDPDGTPIPNVYVTVQRWRDSEAMYNYRHPNVLDTKIPRSSNADGLYTWDWAPADKVTFSFGAKKYASKQDVALAATDTPHEIELSPNLYISGTVSDENGDDLKTFSVIPMTVLRGSAHERRDRGFVSTDGFFEVSSNREDAGLQVKIEAAGFQTHITKVFRVGDEFEPLAIVMKAVEPLDYKVIDVDGRPAANADVLVATQDERLMLDFEAGRLRSPLSGKHTSTDENGDFQLEPPTKPRTLIAFSKDGYGEVADLPDQPNSEIRLMKWFEVSGKVSVDGELDGARVSANPTRFIHGSSYHIQQRHDAVTRPGGQFRLSQLPQMPFRLSFNRSREADPRQRRYSIAVEPKSGSDSVEVKLTSHVSGQIKLAGKNTELVNLLKSEVKLRSVGPTVRMPTELQKLIKKNRLDPNNFDAVEQFFHSTKNLHAIVAYHNCFDSYSILPDQSGRFDLKLMRPGNYELTIKLNPDYERYPFLPLGEFNETLKVDSSGVDLGPISIPTFAVPKSGSQIENLMFKNRGTGLPSWLYALREKYVLIDFWKPWDETSKADAVKLKKLATFLDHEQLTVLSLHSYNKTDDDRKPKRLANRLVWIEGEVEIKNLQAFRKQVAALTPQHYILLDPKGKFVADGDLDSIREVLSELKLTN